MSLVAAGFLGALLLIALPWWLHRLEAQASVQRTVSSLFLMRPAEEPSQRDKALKHLLLLAVRVLLVMLLVAAFAQPVLERVSANLVPEAAPARIVVVDTSASMARDGVFEAALAQARGLLDGRAALLTADAELKIVTPLTDDRAARAAGLQTLAPTSARLSYDGLLARVVNVTRSLLPSGAAAEIHLISDFQASGLGSRFNALVDGVVYPVTLHAIAADPANVAVTRLDAGAVEVTVHGALEQPVEVAVQADDELILQDTISTPGAVRFELPPVAEGRHDRVLQASVTAADDLDADDQRFFVLPRSRTYAVPLLGANRSRRVYVSAALASSLRLEPVPDAPLDGPAVVLVDPAEQPVGLRDYLESGGAALMFAGEAVAVEPWLGNLADLRVTGISAHDAARVQAADPGHPALAGFAAWRDVLVYQHVDVDEAGDVLLRLDDGAPLLIERRVGLGRMLVLLTVPDPEWGSLVAGPAFASFVADALTYLGEDLVPTTAIAGEPFHVPVANLQLLAEDGSGVLSLDESTGRGRVSVAHPGVFEVRTAAAAAALEGRRYLAVNLDPRESDPAPVDAELLTRWQAALRLEQRPAAPGAVTEPSDVPLAPWLLGLLVLLVVLEPVFANGAWRRRPA